MKYYKTLGELHQDNGLEPPKNPFFSLIDYESYSTLKNNEFVVDSYIIYLKKLKSGFVAYGRTPYDPVDGTMLFIKPRELVRVKDFLMEEEGFLILFDEDYIFGSDLQETIGQYGFFDYKINEALHLSAKEELVMWDLYSKISSEYVDVYDTHNKEIIISYLTSLLKYVQRYYKRQFINRKNLSANTVNAFNDLVTSYASDGSIQKYLIPFEEKVANELLVSPRYLNDMLKQETGHTAADYIQLAVVANELNALRSKNDPKQK